MILDNENENLKVHEWIASYTEQGKLDIVTGYFTIGALAWLSKTVNDKISDFRLVLGDIVNFDSIDQRPLDLLNENISIEASLKLSSLSKEAVIFLKQDKVVAKTLEPNFCHAKSYLFNPDKKDDRNKYFISGSSNLTEAGIGLKHTNNIELNIAETGNNNQYKELVEWFDSLWVRPQAHIEKTLVSPDGTNTKIDFKQYLINEIERIFIKYTPRELYYKVLFELFGNQLLETENDPDFNRQIGRLENSVVFNTLYEFQKKGVLSLIRMLQKYNGAILADAVGLGKTWSALAVIKFFQLQGREVLLLCPKKLEHNWRRYLKHQDSRFEKDQFDFFLRFHTDMHEDRVEKYVDRADKYFTNDKPKLIVIDESHNLRNDKSNRYKFLLEQILKENEDIKVLLLSATPINNSLNDIRNQFKLMVQGDVGGYEETLGIRNLDYTFRTAQKVFNEWREEPSPRISDFIKKLPANFFTLTDSLIVARTRKMIEGQQIGLSFPVKTKPLNLFVTPSQLGNFESFEELFDHFPPMLSGYQPSFYLEEEDEEEKDVLHDERQRDRFLVKMMYILMVKRLESSWYSFYSTVEKIKDHHQNALDKIKAYQEGKANSKLNEKDENLFDDDDLQDDYEELTLGKKRKINLSDIDASGNLENFKKDLKKDLDALDNLFINLQKFENKIDKETLRPGNLNSADDKLQTLIAEINKKRATGENNGNAKVVIFTVYRDTAQYLFDQLKSRGFDKLAMVSGSGSQTSDSDEETKNFEPILERFAPYTKLYMEKEWDFQTPKKGTEAYHEWISWVAQNHPKTYAKIQQPIDILIATDALSEGQNLQDADMVINYDIHWNPVRIIQRLGRIDRLGSPNNKIFGINFWPSNNINSYLNLQGRIEQRMAAMKLAGAEVDEKFSETFQEMIHDESLDQRMKNRMMEQMQVTFDDLDGNETFGFDDLSLERYRQDLLEEFNKDKVKYLRMPKGVYTGFKADTSLCAENGLIALLGYPARPAKSPEHEYKVFDLLYINKQGKLVLLNQKDVLDALTHHKDKDRFVPDEIDKGDDAAIQELVSAIKAWLDSQASEEQVQEDGTTKKVMGTEAKDLLSKLRKGDKDALSRVKQNVKVDEKFQLDNFDLITWFLVTA
ncbi:helicase [Kaistella solincola]|uniref:Helicase n=1 Tax=Kaistella solincola TaxID=510955 RepID=A0ABR4ZPR5_9FLAO|nr:SNF2-related protein [Kaistella solincola]KIA82562.1 helicase [Kaistella solincola]